VLHVYDVKKIFCVVGCFVPARSEEKDAVRVDDVEEYVLAVACHLTSTRGAGIDRCEENK
jgi:hypothetical protein